MIPPAMLCVQAASDARAVCEALARAEIETRRWYLPPLYEHPVFSDLPRIGRDGSARLPATEHLASTLIGLPFHTRLTSDDVACVVTALGAELERLSAIEQI
jgi:dTDP-4-amino-4,6-dideoxygalactose transaminase